MPNDGELSGKPPSESAVEMTELVLPNDANTLGNILGGKVMHLIDIAAAICAFRHCRRPVVTVSMDNLSFLHPIKVGHVVILKARITRAFRTSMEISVSVYSEEPLTGERKLTSTAFITFVALDEDGMPMPAPRVLPQTDEEEEAYRLAEERRLARLAMAGG